MKTWQGVISVWDDSKVAPKGVYRQHMPKVFMTDPIDCPVEEIRKFLHERVDMLCNDLALVENSKVQGGS